jgi:hypothetical protein
LLKTSYYQWGQRSVGRIATNLADHSCTLAETQVHWWFSMQISGQIECRLPASKTGAWRDQHHCCQNQHSHISNL